MNTFSQFFTSSPGIALIVSTLIFIIALILIASRVISFWITLLLLLFSVLVGFTIANNDAFREYLRCRKQAQEEQRFKNFTKHILEGFDKLKDEVDQMSEKLQNLIKERDAQHDEEIEIID